MAGVVCHNDERTASCHTTCDLNGCSIMGFQVGAMSRAREISLEAAAGPGPVLAIVAPDDPEAMFRHCGEARRAGIPFFFDPSFQVIALDGPTLLAAAEGAQALVVNEYEQAVFQEKTGKSGEEVLELVGMTIVTLGDKGSRVELPGGEVLSIPPIAITSAVDPTGAGDAFRGGFLAGWAEGRSLEVCGRMGSVAGAFAVEQRGTQEHRYHRKEFLERYQSSYGTMPDPVPGLIEERWRAP
jgi:adenosine kinase